MTHETVALRHLAACLDSHRVPLNREQRQKIPGNVPYWGSGGVVGHISKSMFDEVLVLLGEDGAPFFVPGRDVAFCVSGPVWINNHIHVLRPITGVDPRFLTYALNSVDYARYITGSTRDKLTQDDMSDIQVVMPLLEVQRRVADFLDDQVALLDRAIHLRQLQIAGTKEARDVGIERLVLGAEVPEPKSQADFEPLGTVPDGWRQARLRSVDCEVQTGPFGSQLHAGDYVSVGWPVINPANLKGETIVADPNMLVSEETRERLARHVVQAGDVIFGRRGQLGRAALVSDDHVGWLCGTGSLRVRFRGSDLDPGYLARYLRISALKYYFQRTSVGSTMDNLNTAILLDMPLLVPSRDEQREIAERCCAVSDLAQRACELVTQSILLLQERKQALITAAVTGAFDVSTASARSVA